MFPLPMALLSLLGCDASSDAPAPSVPCGEGDISDTPRLHTLIVGVDDFRYLGPSRDLRFAEADARAFAAQLRSSGGELITEPPRLLLGQDASLSGLRDALEELKACTTYRDTVLLFFSSHGLVSESGEGYLMAWDSDLRAGLGPEVALPMAEVKAALELADPQHVLLFTDACHAGAMASAGQKAGVISPIHDAVLALETAAPSFFNLASSNHSQTSEEDARWCGGHGAFTCALLEALGGQGDRNQDGWVSLGELAADIPERVYRMTDQRQLPQYAGSFDTELTLFSIPEASTPPVGVLDPPPGETRSTTPRPPPRSPLVTGACLGALSSSPQTRAALEAAARELRGARGERLSLDCTQTTTSTSIGEEPSVYATLSLRALDPGGGVVAVTGARRGPARALLDQPPAVLQDLLLTELLPSQLTQLRAQLGL